ncbi:unnamed protein product [Boreogadus saida]
MCVCALGLACHHWSSVGDGLLSKQTLVLLKASHLRLFAHPRIDTGSTGTSLRPTGPLPKYMPRHLKNMHAAYNRSSPPGVTDVAEVSGSHIWLVKGKFEGMHCSPTHAAPRITKRPLGDIMGPGECLGQGKGRGPVLSDSTNHRFHGLFPEAINDMQPPSMDQGQRATEPIAACAAKRQLALMRAFVLPTPAVRLLRSPMYCCSPRRSALPCTSERLRLSLLPSTVAALETSDRCPRARVGRGCGARLGSSTVVCAAALPRSLSESYRRSVESVDRCNSRECLPSSWFSARGATVLKRVWGVNEQVLLKLLLKSPLKLAVKSLLPLLFALWLKVDTEETDR